MAQSASLNQTEPEWEFPEKLEFLFKPHRYKVAYGGRGGTKSWGYARGLLIKGWQRPLRILCAREVQKSLKDSVHQLLVDQAQRLGFGSFYQPYREEIQGKNGTKFIFAGLSNLTAESIKSYEGIDIVWVEEAQAVTQRSWDILIPTIRKDESEIWISFNPDLDTDETWVRFVENTPEAAKVVKVSYHDNPWFPQVLEEERQDFLKQVEAGARSLYEYENIWEGKCKPSVDGAIYPEQIAAVLEEERLCHVPHNPSLHTHLVWDLGYSGMMTIGFVQRQGPSVHFIDYIEDSHRTYDSYVQQIRTKAEKHGYRIALDGREGGKAWLPHDGKQTRPEIGKSPIEILNELGLKAPKDGIPDIGIKGRIEAGRQMFHRCLFDKKKCLSLFNRLRRYAMKLNPEDHSTSIRKDGNDHAGDMFTEVAVIEAELGSETVVRKPIKYSNAGIV